MALVAFDLDNTLGFFDHIAPVAHFMSAETLENGWFRALNPNFYLSPELKERMARAEDNFVDLLLERPHLLRLIFRPNLDAIIRCIITNKLQGRIARVCIYSNTLNTFTMRIATKLIEQVYGAPGLFCAAVDATHPIRAADYEAMPYGEPLKTLRVLKGIFRRLCGYPLHIRAKDVIFIDERHVKHALERYEHEGLTYLKPSPYFPAVPKSHKKEILDLMFKALEKEDLLFDIEYFSSSIFRCLKRRSDNNRIQAIGTFGELIEFVKDEIDLAGTQRVLTFKDDTKEIRRTLLRAFSKI